MKNAVKLFTFLILVFLLLYSFSASFDAALGELWRIVSFGAPVFVGFAVSRKYKREREEMRGLAEEEATLFGITGKSALGLLPLVAPLVALVFVISCLTSLLLGLVGITDGAVEDAPLLEMIFVHALLPTVLEEMLFRYLPMKLIAPYSRRWCVILSTLYFGLIHMSIFQLPYTLFAGAVFIILDIACNSVLPSLILHFINNTVAVFWIKYGADPGFATAFITVILALAVISFIPIFIRRRSYINAIGSALDVGEGNTEMTSPMIFISFTLIMSVLNTISLGG